jgi:hypothetical protein
LDWSETTDALRTTIFKKLEDVLPVMTLTEEECGIIMHPLLFALLLKAGYNRDFPQKVFFESPSLLVGGFHDIHTTQILKHLAMVLQHGPTAVLTNPACIKLVLGFSRRPLNSPLGSW